jgi:hypothetical protein
VSVELAWYVPGRVIYTPGTPIKQEIAIRNAMVLEWLETEGEPPLVHVLIDHTNRYNTGQLREQTSARVADYVNLDNEEVRQKLLAHPLLGWIISVATPNPALKMAGTISSQQRNYRWHSVDTLRYALEFLNDRDSSLPDLKTIQKPL